MKTNAVIWSSEKSAFWTAKEGSFLSAVPVLVAVTDNSITVTRWFSILFLLLNVGLFGVIRMMGKAAPLLVGAENIRSIRIEKTWVDNPIARRRFEANGRMLYRLCVNADGTSTALRIFLRRDDLQSLKAVPWFRAVAVGP